MPRLGSGTIRLQSGGPSRRPASGGAFLPGGASMPNLSSSFHDVAVIGLGAMGAAALYQLARRGVKAVGIDRFSPPHPVGSTHGETRITRQAVGEGEVYVPLVLRSNTIWEELE